MLFAAGEEGLKAKEIAQILQVDTREVRRLLKEMAEEWREAGRGIQIVEVAQVFQLTTLPEHRTYFEKLAEAPSRSQLSRSALETLAIIAYRQPIIRVDVEEIRGVKCERTIYQLKRKGLVKETGRAEGVGRPILYGTTREFLEYFGLKSLEELPPVDSIFHWAEWEQEREELYQRLGVEPQQEEAPVKEEDEELTSAERT